MVAALTDDFRRSGFRNKICHYHAVVKSFLWSGSILVWYTTNRSQTRSWLLELATMNHFLSFRILVQRWFKRFLDCTIAWLFLSHHLLTRSVLKDTRRVVWISHQRVDKGVDLGLFSGNCRIFGRLILDLEFGVLRIIVVALVDALLARAISHVYGCRIDDLRGDASHCCSVRVRFQVAGGVWSYTAPFLALGGFRGTKGLELIGLLLVLIIGVAWWLVYLQHALRWVFVNVGLDRLEQVLVLLVRAVLAILSGVHL